PYLAPVSLRLPPTPALFPYTTLFRSRLGRLDAFQQAVNGLRAKGGRSHVIGQPQLQQATQSAKVAIDSGQLAHTLIVGDALNPVALAYVQEEVRQALARRSGVLSDGLAFRREAIHLDWGICFPGCFSCLHVTPRYVV